ncbi:hypothetical protein EOM86_12130 [Candidatus Nomurabacteria bacterium]|nr:hypothetical protein [Candidatus Nomurabacteria bacterium]
MEIYEPEHLESDLTQVDVEAIKNEAQWEAADPEEIEQLLTLYEQTKKAGCKKVQHYAKIADYVINGRVCGHYVKSVSRTQKRGYIPCSKKVYDAFERNSRMYQENTKYGRRAKWNLVAVDLFENVVLTKRIVKNVNGDDKYADVFDSYVTLATDEDGDEEEEFNELRVSLGFPAWA